MATKKAKHKFLGNVKITDECQLAQQANIDADSIYVEHDGDIKRVTKSLVTVEGEQ